MRAFDEDMAASSSLVSFKPKRERDSPSKKALLGTEVRILSLRKGAFLLSSMGVPGAIFYRGVRKMGSSRLFAACSILFFGAWCLGGRRPVFCACTDSLPTEPIFNGFSGPLFPRSHRSAQAPYRPRMQHNRALLSAARWAGGGWAATGPCVPMVATWREGGARRGAERRFVPGFGAMGKVFEPKKN